MSDIDPIQAQLAPKRSRTPLYLALGIVGAVVVAVLAFGVFGVQTLFTDDEVSEAGPVFESGASAPAGPASTPAGATSSEPSGEAPAVTTVASGTFEERDHPGSGTATILTDGTQTFVRFEDDFSTDNGPDLYAVVYVDGEIVELDTLKGNQGSQNYELPADVDPASIESIAVWCKRFDVIFTEAPLS